MKKLFSALAAVLVTAVVAYSANIPLLTGPQDPSQLNATINTVINQINALINPNTMGQFSSIRNYVDNGSMTIQQRGTGAVTCGTTTIPPATAYGADRWGCNANVTSGAGIMQVITATPSPPTGFVASQKLYRTSGILTQPICAMQELSTATSTQLQGQQVVLSAYVQALAALASDNSNAFNMYVFTGTGSDQGLQSFTASPAITPAWTGIATTGSQAFTATTAWVRYQTNPIVIPVATTEIAVAICFTPTAAAVAGATDGLAFTGVQLEQGTVASSYDFQSYAQTLVRAQAYFYTLSEAAATVVQTPSGNGASTTACTLNIPFPTTMRVAPTFNALGTALSASTWTVTHVVTATALSTPYLATLGANTPNGASMTATVASGLTAGQACVLTGAAGGSILSWTADF